MDEENKRLYSEYTNKTLREKPYALRLFARMTDTFLLIMIIIIISIIIFISGCKPINHGTMEDAFELITKKEEVVMEKVFEDYFSEIQTDMVSICLEYVENRAEAIYIHCIYDNNSIYSNFYCKINGMVVKKHKLNDAVCDPLDGFRYDTATNRQDAVLHILNSDIGKLIDICSEHNRKMPTEIRLYYNVSNKSVEAEYRYESVSVGTNKSKWEVSNEWFDELLSQHNDTTQRSDS